MAKSVKVYTCVQCNRVHGVSLCLFGLCEMLLKSSSFVSCWISIRHHLAKAHTVYTVQSNAICAGCGGRRLDLFATDHEIWNENTIFSSTKTQSCKDPIHSDFYPLDQLHFWSKNQSEKFEIGLEKTQTGLCNHLSHCSSICICQWSLKMPSLAHHVMCVLLINQLRLNNANEQWISCASSVA